MKSSIFTFTTLFLFAAQAAFSQISTSKIYKNGILNGQYESVYANGRMKAQGNFEYNQRVGEWKVWDSLGNLRMIRNYINNTDFTTSAAYNSENELVKFTPSVQNKRIKNDQGFYEYTKVAMSDVIWAKRIWREIGKTEMNNALFKDDRLFKILMSHIKDKTLIGYKNSDQFIEPLNEADILNLTQKSDYEVIGFTIKEDWFYDKSRQVLDVQILGISPIVLLNNQPTNLLWVYFPQTKTFLSETTTTNPISLDDFFFQRKFNSTITKESNVYDSNLDAYTSKDQLNAEIERIEISIIEQEHTQWIESTEK